MKLSTEGLLELMRLEGSSRTIYKDVGGKPTIGVGHLVTEEELEKYQHISLSDYEIQELLKKDVEKFEQNVTNRVLVPLQQHKFDALVIFSFNVGNYAFNNSTLLSCINANALWQVPYQLSRWSRVNGKVSRGLVNRRNAEIEIWLYGYGAR